MNCSLLSIRYCLWYEKFLASKNCKEDTIKETKKQQMELGNYRKNNETDWRSRNDDAFRRGNLRGPGRMETESYRSTGDKAILREKRSKRNIRWPSRRHIIHLDGNDVPEKWSYVCRGLCGCPALWLWSLFSFRQKFVLLNGVLLRIWLWYDFICGRD